VNSRREATLVLNAGSSTLKFALYDARDLGLMCRANLEGLGGAGAARLSASGELAQAFVAAGAPESGDHAAALGWTLDVLKRALPDVALVAAGHRIVHGGRHFSAPARLTPDVMEILESLTPMAPGHQPHNLAGVKALAKLMPDLPQVGCFDTAFHRTQPRLAQLTPLPRALIDEGYVRYGFHGLSYAYIASVLPQLTERARGRVIVAHLGSGASLCAMRDLRSVTTSMGFTSLDGLMMGTRSGALDPGLVLHLIQHRGMSVREVSDMLNKQSGLLGVSGLSNDLRALEQSDAPEAEEAMALFAWRAAREIGSAMAAIGGLDALVFTAGIGEHSAAMRARICDYLGFAGVTLDARANAAHAQRISPAGAAVDVLATPTDEEIMIARGARDVLAG
jgi:acetate kinase